MTWLCHHFGISPYASAPSIAERGRTVNRKFAIRSIHGPFDCAIEVTSPKHSATIRMMCNSSYEIGSPSASKTGFSRSVPWAANSASTHLIRRDQRRERLGAKRRPACRTPSRSSCSRLPGSRGGSEGRSSSSPVPHSLPAGAPNPRSARASIRRACCSGKIAPPQVGRPVEDTLERYRGRLSSRSRRGGPDRRPNRSVARSAVARGMNTTRRGACQTRSSRGCRCTMSSIVAESIRQLAHQTSSKRTTAWRLPRQVERNLIIGDRFAQCG